MALISVISRLSKRLKIIRPHIFNAEKPPIKYGNKVLNANPPKGYDAFGYRFSSLTTPLPHLSCPSGNLHLVKRYCIVARDPDGDHRTTWMVQRAVAVGLLGLVPAAFVFPSEVMDGVLATIVVGHQHWGLAHVLSDYASPRNLGSFVAIALQCLNYVLSLAVLGGLLLFNHNDVGIAAAVSRLWELGKEDKQK